MWAFVFARFVEAGPSATQDLVSETDRRVIEAWARQSIPQERFNEVQRAIDRSVDSPEIRRIQRILIESSMDLSQKIVWIRWIARLDVRTLFTWMLPENLLATPVEHSWLNEAEEYSIARFFSDFSRWEFPSSRRSHLAFGDLLLLFSRFNYSSDSLIRVFHLFEQPRPRNEIVEGEALVWILSIGPSRISTGFLDVIELILDWVSQSNDVDELRLRGGLLPSVAHAQRNCAVFYWGASALDSVTCGVPLVSFYPTVALNLVADILSDGRYGPSQILYTEDHPFFSFIGTRATGLFVEAIENHLGNSFPH